MNTNIRKASAEDYDSLCTLFDKVDALHRNNLPHIFIKPDGPVRECDYYLGLISDENIGLFVAELDGNVVGFVHVIIKEAPDIPVFIQRRYAVVDSILVESAFQKHGIGKSLMDKMQEWSFSKGAESIELNVYEFNSNAISFYKRRGYRTLSRKMSKELK
ncbi:MAG: GNAT family N-acetyltransferase [Anaerolineales bacterium]|nr:GNAT family N-acetyltransferase [Anaerolineales bacterium]